MGSVMLEMDMMVRKDSLRVQSFFFYVVNIVD